eukprot:TRINITY_DN6787_c0_g1_i2.p1 TRINITY_DN6787_c0_g1~~TRINITY_DN6787_c0_g1_i2.p1  ORF type:complete len:316 (+),score=61.05 TRINITY_DN6787_c0_g1_i2:350-1297(+)
MQDPHVSAATVYGSAGFERTALHDACEAGWIECVRVLVATPACVVTALDARKNTPLHLAARGNDTISPPTQSEPESVVVRDPLACVRLLVADPRCAEILEAPNDSGLTPVALASTPEIAAAITAELDKRRADQRQRETEEALAEKTRQIEAKKRAAAQKSKSFLGGGAAHPARQPSANSGPVLFEGFLEKQSHMGRTWSQRYFVLDAEKLVARPSQEPAPAKAIYYLEDYLLRLDSENALQFALVFDTAGAATDGHDVHLRALDTVQMRKWLMALSDAIRARRKLGSSYAPPTRREPPSAQSSQANGRPQKCVVS